MPFDETATTRGYLISEVGVTLHNRKPQQNSNSNCKQGADHRAMAEGRHRQEEHEEEDYVIAFKSGNKLVAEQLLPRIPQPVAITTTFKFSKLLSCGSIGLSGPPSCVLGLEKCRYCASICV